MITLTEEEAAKVRGISPYKEGHALIPIPAKDGTYYLGEEVLEDTAHEDLWELLGSLPRKDIKDIPVFTELDLDQPAIIEADKLSVRVEEIKGAEEI